MYRVVEIQFKPQSSAQWSIHADVRTEAARLWFRMCRIHAWCRKLGKPWPNLPLRGDGNKEIIRLTVCFVLGNFPLRGDGNIGRRTSTATVF